MSPTQTMEGDALGKEIDAGIDDLSAPVPPGVVFCGPAHWAQVNALKILLRCQKANLEERARERLDREQETKDRRAETIGIALGAAGVIATLITVVVPLIHK